MSRRRGKGPRRTGSPKAGEPTTRVSDPPTMERAEEPAVTDAPRGDAHSGDPRRGSRRWVPWTLAALTYAGFVVSTVKTNCALGA